MNWVTTVDVAAILDIYNFIINDHSECVMCSHSMVTYFFIEKKQYKYVI